MVGLEDIQVIAPGIVKAVACGGQVGVFASEARARFWMGEIGWGGYDAIPKEME